MSFFEPVHDLFRRHAATSLNDSAACVYLVNRREESPRGNFVFPGTDYLDDIEVGGQRVGHVDYGINPLGDRLYVYNHKKYVTTFRPGEPAEFCENI
jgi:hypothetical protein